MQLSSHIDTPLLHSSIPPHTSAPNPYARHTSPLTNHHLPYHPFPLSVVDTDSMNGALSALRAQLSEAEAHTKTAREQHRVMAESKVRAEMMRERLLLTSF
jgi:hypothetical protein